MTLIEPLLLVSAGIGAVVGAVLGWPTHPLMGLGGAVAGAVLGPLALFLLLFALSFLIGPRPRPPSGPPEA